MGPAATRLARRFFALSGAERRLLIRAVSLVVAVRLGLSLLPSRVLLRHVSGRAGAPRSQSRVAAFSPAQIAWAVSAASRRVPHATCLTQALAAQLLLDWDGHPSRLCLGVARGSQGEFQAHAWVESGGLVVIGGQELERYSQLPDLETISR
jgi:hypothetical protein